MSFKTMTTKELAKKIVNNEKQFILDVRATDAFADWKIEGKNIEVINEPYFNLIDDVAAVKDRLPDDEPKLVVCAKGGSSEMVAEQLIDAGFENVYSLEGGMKAWSEHLEPVKIADLNGSGELYQFVRLGKGCLSYMILSDGVAAVFDANRMTDVYKSFAEEKDAVIKYTVDTHLHADHISGGKQLADDVGGTYYLPPKDASDVTFDYTPLEDGSDISIGNTKIKVQPLYSPGHTLGSTSLIINDQYLLTGDILFVQSIGRPDLAGKADDWVADLRETLYQRYRDLSQDMMVLPAHYSTVKELGDKGQVQARLGDLYNDNKGLQVSDDRKFRQMVTENLPPQPNAYQDIRETNMGKKTPEEDKQRDMEIGPNRCAIHE
ncbi:MBL fold metallo-hydrolase [Tuberibacillus sp. Marseille-P3662]|uniref:MBL fold metallo-hydrolase n=1 Tax=Tuberibacillus sp. Marseille-P3662 TaxID=1965358 RepID=UPI000A1CA030|nr:MBL fold metallo-hydrolase [Tuberibacillus sp. Marseille-P3662]